MHLHLYLLYQLALYLVYQVGLRLVTDFVYVLQPKSFYLLLQDGIQFTFQLLLYVILKHILDFVLISHIEVVVIRYQVFDWWILSLSIDINQFSFAVVHELNLV